MNSKLLTILIPLLLVGCGSSGPTSPCKDYAGSANAKDVATAKKRTDRLIEVQKKVLRNKYSARVTIDAPVTTCAAGSTTVNEAGENVVVKASCKVKMHYCVNH